MSETQEMTVIERAMRALCEAQGYRPQDITDWTTWDEEVRAVLQAIREPSMRMAEAGYEQLAAMGAEGGPWGVYQAMIDAALSE